MKLFLALKTLSKVLRDIDRFKITMDEVINMGLDDMFDILIYHRIIVDPKTDIVKHREQFKKPLYYFYMLHYVLETEDKDMLDYVSNNQYNNVLAYRTIKYIQLHDINIEAYRRINSTILLHHMHTYTIRPDVNISNIKHLIELLHKMEEIYGLGWSVRYTFQDNKDLSNLITLCFCQEEHVNEVSKINIYNIDRSILSYFPRALKRIGLSYTNPKYVNRTIQFSDITIESTIH